MEEPVAGSLDVTLGKLELAPVTSEDYFGIAESLMPAARVLTASTEISTGFGLAFISAHILECLLKAFLSKKGLTKDLKRRSVRHNLSELWSRSIGLGFPVIPSWAERLSALHNEPFPLRYSKSHGLVLPGAQPMSSESEELLEVVRMVMRSDA